MPILRRHSLWLGVLLSDDDARQAIEQTALTHGTTIVRVEALLKHDERSRAKLATLWAPLNEATAAVNHSMEIRHFCS
jgi:hypothetical protein